MKKSATIALVIIIGLVSLYFLEVSPEDPELTDPEKLTEFSSRMIDFSFNSFFELAKEEENLFVSPYSIHTAMTMAYRGADGETAEETAEVLGLTDKEMDKILEDSLDLKRYLEHFSSRNELAIANSFFLRGDIPFLESYRRDGERYFEAEIGPLPETGEPINDWVYEKTREKIEEIIDDGPIDEDVIAYLVNAIYFQGNWAEEFDPENTRTDTFQAPQGDVEVEMMENEADYKYEINEEFQSVTLEYEDGDFLFHAFMPTEKTLPQFYEDFSVDTFQDMKPNNKREVVLRMPKFTLEDELELVEVLQALGIQKAFNRNEADFSKMVDTEALGLNVFLSDVLHASFIEVDEEGTEAAAATAVEISLESMPMAIEFNRPFLFVIEEPKTETILFMGQLVDPN